MKITIEDDDGKTMSLETALIVIPPGYTVLVCPKDKEYHFSHDYKATLQAELNAWGIKAVVVPMPVCVWAIADDARA